MLTAARFFWFFCGVKRGWGTTEKWALHLRGEAPTKRGYPGFAQKVAFAQKVDALPKKAFCTTGGAILGAGHE
jgi:hypothetical protein